MRNHLHEVAQPLVPTANLRVGPFQPTASKVIQLSPWPPLRLQSQAHPEALGEAWGGKTGIEPCSGPDGACLPLLRLVGLVPPKWLPLVASRLGKGQGCGIPELRKGRRQEIIRG